MRPMLELDSLICQYNNQPVVNGFNMQLGEGMLACLLGASGCGKTSVLRSIAGLQTISGGQIRIDGGVVASVEQHIAPEKRQVGMVFQDYALFPHLSVADNILFGVRGLSRKQRKSQLEYWLEVVRLQGYAERYPHELSGGQQQRVALARALAPRPRLLLLDEPFSNLDVEMREQLALEIRDILKSEGITALFVTHDQHEAFVIGDKVAIMHEGKIMQWDTPFNLYHEPASRFVAGFIGQGELLPGHMLSDHSVQTEVGTIQGNRSYPWRDNTAVDVLLRPDDVIISEQGQVGCKVVEKAFRGAETLYKLQLDSGRFVYSLMPSHEDFVPGQSVRIEVSACHLVAFK